MKIADRLGPDFRIQCGNCTNRLEHDIEDETMSIVMECDCIDAIYEDTEKEIKSMKRALTLSVVIITLIAFASLAYGRSSETINAEIEQIKSEFTALNTVREVIKMRMELLNGKHERLRVELNRAIAQEAQEAAEKLKAEAKPKKKGRK